PALLGLFTTTLPLSALPALFSEMSGCHNTGFSRTACCRSSVCPQSMRCRRSPVFAASTACPPWGQSPSGGTTVQFVPKMPPYHPLCYEEQNRARSQQEAFEFRSSQEP